MVYLPLWKIWKSVRNILPNWMESHKIPWLNVFQSPPSSLTLFISIIIRPGSEKFPCSSWSSPQPPRATTSTWALAAPVATLPFAYRGRWIQQKRWKPTRKLLPYWGYDEIYNELYWDLSIQVNYIQYTIIYILLYDVQRLRNPALLLRRILSFLYCHTLW